MARGLFRKTSFNKMVGAYRSQWKRFWMRLFTFGLYGRKGMGWWRDPKKAWYNWWYHRTSISIPRLLGYRPSYASFFCAMLVASVVSLFAAPVDIARAGVKAHKIKTATKARSKLNGVRSSASTGTNTGSTSRATSGSTRTYSGASTATPGSPNSTKSRTDDTCTKTTSCRESHSDSARRSSANPAPKHRTSTSGTPKNTYMALAKSVGEEKSKHTAAFSSSAYSYEPIKPITSPEPEGKAFDADAPKSAPKHEKDQYIRKRMIIAGSSYCDKDVLNRLSVGAYLEIAAEPTNPYDKDAVMLMYEGQKVGYISKQDKLPFVTCLRLNRKIYAVITDIITEPYPTKYEFETWFDSEK